jgi:hypothetical protein
MSEQPKKLPDYLPVREEYSITDGTPYPIYQTPLNITESKFARHSLCTWTNSNWCDVVFDCRNCVFSERFSNRMVYVTYIEFTNIVEDLLSFKENVFNDRTTK